MLVYSANIYFWRRYKINYPFIFGFKQGTELGYIEVFLLSNGLAVIALTTLLVHLHVKMDSGSPHYETYIELLPLGLVVVRNENLFFYQSLALSFPYYLLSCRFVYLLHFAPSTSSIVRAASTSLRVCFVVFVLLFIR